MLILYNPPSNPQRKAILPMSLLALGAVLEGEHDYVIVDGNIEVDPVAALDRAIRETRAGLLAVTVMPGPQLEAAVRHCRRIRSLHPGLAVVWGGYFPTQHFDACLLSDCVDFVIRGHGEMAFKGLVEALLRDEDPAGIPGLAYRDPAKGEVQSNGLSPIPHPDRLPDFPYHRVDMDRYLRPTFMGAKTLPHHSSYGCPFFCNFCAVVNMVNGRWLAQSAGRTSSVSTDLVRRFGADAVEFYDNNFFAQEARTAEFAERILGLGIGWWGEARIDTLLRYSNRTWELMKRSGLRMVFLGAESGSDETLRRMNKGGTAAVEKTLALVERMGRYDIVPELSFVLGTPPDPERDVEQSLELIRNVKRMNPLTEIVLYLYTPVPLAGSLYDDVRDKGFRFPETLDEWVAPEWTDFSQRRSSGLPWLDENVRRRVHGFERVLNAYYPTSTDPHLTRPMRWLLRALSAWRYRLKIYHFPFELQALHRLVAYQRPETSGF